MKLNVFQSHKSGRSGANLVILMASAQPDPQVLGLLGGRADLSCAKRLPRAASCSKCRVSAWW